MKLVRAKYKGKWYPWDQLQPDWKFDEIEAEADSTEIEKMSHTSVIKSIERKK